MPQPDHTAMELSLGHGPLRHALDAIHRAKQAVDDAQDRVTDCHVAFGEVLRDEIAARHTAGTDNLADEVAALVRTAYWDHRELRVADIATGTGLTQQQVRQVAGPLLVDTRCSVCTAPTQAARSSRSDTVRFRMCQPCEEIEHLANEPSPFLFDGHELGLRRHLDQRIDDMGCDHTLALTRRWAMREGIDPGRLASWVQARGGYCDCEVVLNLTPGVPW